MNERERERENDERFFLDQKIIIIKEKYQERDKKGKIKGNMVGNAKKERGKKRKEKKGKEGNNNSKESRTVVSDRLYHMINPNMND